MLRDDFDKYKEEIEGYAGKGNRVLVFGTYDGELDGKALTGKERRLDMSFLPIQSEKKHRRHLLTLQNRV